MSTPDIVIRLDDDGRIVEVLSTLPITYATVEAGHIPGKQLSTVKEQDFLGSYKQILVKLGLNEPSSEFDFVFMFTLCHQNPLLKKALEKTGYSVDADDVAFVKASTSINHKLVKELKTLYNAFVKADKKLMEQYLNLQK